MSIRLLSCHTDRHWWLTSHFTRNVCSLTPLSSLVLSPCLVLRIHFFVGKYIYMLYFSLCIHIEFPIFFGLAQNHKLFPILNVSPNVHLTCYFSICHRKSTVSGWYVPLNPIYVQWFKLGISMDKSISMNIISSHLFPYPQLLLVKS